MAQAFVTAKSILVSYNLLAPTNEKGERSRGTAYEFQDYAYRLAADLNDLEHKNIYMGLARRYPRHLLEEVYSAIADIDTDSKGKLFMWKLKQIRIEQEMREWKKNFDNAFIAKKMAKLRDRLSDSIIKKANGEGETLFNILKYAQIANLSSKSRALILGGGSKSLCENLSLSFNKIDGIEISRNIAKFMNSEGRFKFTTKPFLEKKLKTSYYDYIFVYKAFDLVALEEEHNFIKKLKTSLNSGGKVILIVSNIANDEFQSWKEIIQGEEVTLYFYKQNSLDNLKKKIENEVFKLVTVQNFDKLNLLIIENES